MPRNPSTRALDGTYFFTVQLQDLGSDVLVREIDTLRSATRAMMHQFPTQIDAIVVLPSIIHAIWTLPAGDTQYLKRWSSLKHLFLSDFPSRNTIELSQRPGNKRGFWQTPIWVHRLQNWDDFHVHRTMMYHAPVKHGLVRSATDWQYSSIHRDQLLREPSPAAPTASEERTPIPVVSSG